MSVPRQGGSMEGGRVNQKKRTRADLVEAAKALLEEGTTPSVAQAAEAAAVSRTTAYRYFPTQDALLLEVAVNVGVDDLEELVGRPLAEGESSVERTLTVMRGFNQRVADQEVRYRTLTRLYLDLWLAAAADGDAAPVVREGRRRRWIDTSLPTADPALPPADRARLVAALCVLMGPEAMSVLCDVAQLDHGEAIDVAEWAARTLIAATLDEP